MVKKKEKGKSLSGTTHIQKWPINGAFTSSWNKILLYEVAHRLILIYDISINVDNYDCYLMVLDWNLIWCFLTIYISTTI